MRSSCLSPMYSIRHLRTTSLLFSTEADGSCQKVKSDQNSQPDDSSTNHRTSVFQPYKHMCMLFTQKSLGGQFTKLRFNCPSRLCSSIRIKNTSISTLSISHLKCFLKHVSVDLLCVKRLLRSSAHSWKMVTRELHHLHTYAASMSINKKKSWSTQGKCNFTECSGIHFHNRS